MISYSGGAGQIETFRTAIADGLSHASFAAKRAIVELIVDRVVVDAPEVEIRYVFPLTSLAERQGVLRLHHRCPAEAGAVLPIMIPVAVN